MAQAGQHSTLQVWGRRAPLRHKRYAPEPADDNDQGSCRLPCNIQSVGGGGAGGSTSSDTGGGGGYATITLGPLGSITTYFLVVGGGGTANGPGGASISGYTGGSPAGGGASGVWTSNYGGTPVVVAGGGGGIGHSGNGWQSGFAAGVTTYSGIALQETGGVTTGADCDYGGGGAGYPDGGAACPVSGYWSGGGGDNYAAGGGLTTAGSGVNPAIPVTPIAPPMPNRVLRGAGGTVTTARFITLLPNLRRRTTPFKFMWPRWPI